MPIDRTTFEQGIERDSIEREIIRFLFANQSRAYNVYEITAAVTNQGWSEASARSSYEENLTTGKLVDVTTVNTILDRLVHNGGTERRIVDLGDGEQSFYRAVRT